MTDSDDTCVDTTKPAPEQVLAWSVDTETQPLPRHSWRLTWLLASFLALLLVLGAALLIALAVSRPGGEVAAPRSTTQTPPTPSLDDVFRGALRSESIPYDNFADAVELAHDVCKTVQDANPHSLADRIATTTAVLDLIRASHVSVNWPDRWSDQDNIANNTVIKFDSVAQNTYCPKAMGIPG